MTRSVSRVDPPLSGTGANAGSDSVASIGPSQPTRAEVDSYSLAPTDSPCVAVCSTLYDDICRGCGRTALEVANWVFMTESEKKAVWVRISSQGYPRRG